MPIPSAKPALACCHACGQPLPDDAGVVIDAPRRTVSRDGMSAVLTPKTFDLFLILWDARPNALTQEQIGKKLWGSGYYTMSNPANTLWVAFNALRKAISPMGIIISGVRGAGYSITLDGAPCPSPSPSPSPSMA